MKIFLKKLTLAYKLLSLSTRTALGKRPHRTKHFLFSAIAASLLFCSCSTASRAPQSTPDPKFSLGDGYDISTIPDDFRTLKKELEQLQEQNKKLAARIENLEKARGSK